MRGLVWVVLILAAATAYGLWRQRTDGRMRQQSGSSLSVAAGEAHLAGHAEDDDQHPRLTADEIGGELGQAATLVEFSSAFCQPCRATKQVLQQVADMVPGVTFVEIDAEAHLDLVRRLDVRRTPTTLVLDAAGVLRTRAAGTPRKADVIAAIGEFHS